MDYDKVFDESFWSNGPKPGRFYNIPFKNSHQDPVQHSRQPMVTGSSVLGLKFDGGVLIAADTLASFGSLAKYRTISRIYKVNDSTVIGVGGDYADYQFIQKTIEQKVIDDNCMGDGFSYTPKSLHNWLTRVLYNRRSKFNPLLCTILVAGIENNEPYLGYVDKIGTAYEAPSAASGFGIYMAQPLLRSALEVKPNMNEQDAKLVMDYCMKVLYYRDARSWNRYEMAIVTRDKKAEVLAPVSSNTNWDIAPLVQGFE